MHGLHANFIDIGILEDWFKSLALQLRRTENDRSGCFQMNREESGEDPLVRVMDTADFLLPGIGDHMY